MHSARLRRLWSQRFLGAEELEVVSDPKRLFPTGRGDLAQFPGINSHDRAEYARLVTRQLRSRKVRLLPAVQGGGTIFAVKKKDSDKLREVWHGKQLSEVATRPPPPPLLASPGRLLQLEASDSRPIRTSNVQEGLPVLV